MAAIHVFGDQERLELTRSQWGDNRLVCLTRHGTVDFRGDRIQPADALTYRGMRTGNQFLDTRSAPAATPCRLTSAA